MITSDSGLSVENYVGTYHLKMDGDTMFIVSEEFHKPREGEAPLKTKLLYVDDFKNNDYLFLKLANVDISSNESIIEFCNEYGLPYSSAKIADIQPGYYFWGLEMTEQQYAHMYPFYRHDYMSINEFYRHAICARRLMEVKNELESDHPNYENLLKYLLPTLLYFRQELYADDDIEPTNASTRFQKYYLDTRAKYIKTNPNATFKMLVNNFICKYIEASRKQQDAIFEQDLRSDYWLSLADLLLQLFKNDLLKYISFDEHFVLSYSNEFVLPENIRTILDKVGPTILNDTINEGLAQVHPKLTFSGGRYINDWDIRFQYEGLLVELSLLLSAGNQIKKCANPTCEKFFTPDGHRDKLYCSHRCGALVAKRRQRKRDAENPNRKRLEPGFKSRKRPE